MATHENSKTTSMTILLNDLLYDILSRLPVKTLLRCRSVCKSWLSLISSPEFNKIYNTRFTQHHLIMSKLVNHPPIQPLCFFRKDLKLASCSLHSLLNEPVAEATQLDHCPVKDIDQTTYVVGSCNGLICLASFDDNAFLWNRTTRTLKRLPDHKLRLVFEPTVFGFGYDESKDDFKVFAFFCRDGRLQTSVYSLKSDCWRVNENLIFREVRVSGKLAHGAVHWLVREDFIASIDIKSEIYREIVLPKHNGDVDVNSLALHAMVEDLCVIYYSRNTSVAEFWMMNEYGVEESWTKLFSFSYMCKTSLNPGLTPIRFFLNGDVMMIRKSEIVRYKPKDDTFEVLLRLDSPPVKIYVETLVSHHL